jgi:CheY-like chemotaxis protein
MSRHTILVVDDDPLQRAIAATRLASCGHDVHAAADGLEAWRRLRSGAFDAVLLDLDMPRLSGRELISRIKADAELRNLPTLIVSGRRDFESVEAAFVGGAFVFCPKPVNWSLLRTQLNQAIEETRLRKLGYLGGFALAS